MYSRLSAVNAPPIAALGCVSGTTLKCPEVITTPAVGLVLELPAVGLVLELPGIGVMTSKLYLPKLASAPCPGTDIRMSPHSLPNPVNGIVSGTPFGGVITRFGGTEVSSPVKHST